MAVLKKSPAVTKKPAPAASKKPAPAAPAKKPAAAAPVRKVKQPEPEPEQVERLEEGTMVAFDLDGTVTEGKIVAFDEGNNVYHVQVGDDENDVYGVDPEGVTVVEEQQEEEVEEKPKAKLKPGKPAPKATGKGTSFADVFANTAVAEDSAGGYPNGRHVVNCTEYVREGDENERCSVYIQTEGPEGSEIEGMSSRLYWNILDDDGNAHSGLEYLKRDLQKMGYDLNDISTLDDIDGALQQVVDNNSQMEITVKPRRDDPDKQNIFFNSLVEN